MSKQLLLKKFLLFGTLISFALISLVPLNFVSASHSSVSLFHIPFYLVAMALLALLLIIFAYISEPQLTGFDYALIFIVAALSLSQITSVDRLNTSVNILSFSFKGLCFAFIGMRIMKHDLDGIVFPFILVIASIVSLIGLIECFSAWNPFFNIAPALLDSLNRRPGIVSTIGHPIPLAAYLILMLPLAIEYIRKTKAPISYVPLLLMSSTIFLSLSRSGWFAAGLSLLIYFMHKEKIALIKTHRKKAFAVLGLILAIFIFIPNARNTLIARTINLKGLKSDMSYSHRIAAYTTTHKILKDYPLFGVGLGNYPAVHIKYFTQGAHIMINTPDNIYLRFLCETGILGTVVFFSVLSYLLFVLWKNGGDGFIAAIFAGLTGFMVNQLAADLFFWTVTQFTFWLLLGIAFPRVNHNEQKIGI